MDQNNSLKNFSYVGIGRVVSTVLQAIFYLLFAALLEPESYGYLNFIISLAATFSIISGLGLHHTLTIYNSKKSTNQSIQVKTLSLITTSIAALILLPINEFASLLSFAASIFLLNQFELLGFKQYRKFMIITILRGCLIVILPILFYFFLQVPGIVLGLAIGSLITSIPYLKGLRLTSFFDLKKESKVIIHNFGVEASVSLPRVIDKLFIPSLFGFFILGVYQLNLQILFAVEVLPVALHGFLLSEESSRQRHKKLIYLAIIGSIIIVIIGIVLAPFFINEFFPKYSTGISSLQILLISLIPLTISSILTAKLQSIESTKIGFSAIVRIGSLLVLIFILGGLFELIGLSLAFLLSIMINTVFLYYLYRQTKLS